VGFLFGDYMTGHQDIPETASLIDVIRAINADLQWRRSAPQRVIEATRNAMLAAKVREPCGESGCTNETVGRVTKFGETRTTGSPVNTPPGQWMSIWYCEQHKDSSRVALDAL